MPVRSQPLAARGSSLATRALCRRRRTFLMATLAPVAVSSAETTTPYAPVPMGLISRYRDDTVNCVPLTTDVVVGYDDAIPAARSTAAMRGVDAGAGSSGPTADGQGIVNAPARAVPSGAVCVARRRAQAGTNERPTDTGA